MHIAFVNQPQDLIVAAEEQRGSVAIVNIELAKRFAEKHRVTVYAPRGTKQLRHEQWGRIELRRLRFGTTKAHKAVQLLAGRVRPSTPYFSSTLYCRGYFRNLARDLRRNPVDVVLIPQQVQFARMIRAACPRALIVIHMHQDDLAHLNYATLQRHLAHVDAVVTVSDYVTGRARARFPEFAGRIHTIGNGVDPERFRPDPARARATNTRKLLFVGRISPDKGVHVLFEAFDRLASERPDVTLDLVGKIGLLPLDVISVLLKDDAELVGLREFYGRRAFGWLTKEVGQKSSYKAALMKHISPEHVDRVRFLGSIPLPQLIRAYQDADLLVLPSLWHESYGLPVVEAMASGLPVVASRCGGVPELISDGITGVLVPRGDVDALLSTIRELLDEPARMLAMGRAARMRSEKWLTWRESTARLERITAQRPALAQSPPH